LGGLRCSLRRSLRSAFFGGNQLRLRRDGAVMVQ
jgi:hypothetical protein